MYQVTLHVKEKKANEFCQKRRGRGLLLIVRTCICLNEVQYRHKARALKWYYRNIGIIYCRQQIYGSDNLRHCSSSSPVTVCFVF